MGDDALGAITGNWYSAELDYPINKGSSTASSATTRSIPGVYAAETYLCGEVLEHALKGIGGKVEDKPVFMKALKGRTFRTPSRPGQLRRARQRGRQRLHPQGREKAAS